MFLTFTLHRILCRAPDAGLV